MVGEEKRSRVRIQSRAQKPWRMRLFVINAIFHYLALLLLLKKLLIDFQTIDQCVSEGNNHGQENHS